MAKKEFIDTMAEGSKRRKAGDEIRLTGFGSFEVKEERRADQEQSQNKRSHYDSRSQDAGV